MYRHTSPVKLLSPPRHFPLPPCTSPHCCRCCYRCCRCCGIKGVHSIPSPETFLDMKLAPGVVIRRHPGVVVTTTTSITRQGARLRRGGVAVVDPIMAGIGFSGVYSVGAKKSFRRTPTRWRPGRQKMEYQRTNVIKFREHRFKSV